MDFNGKSSNTPSFKTKFPKLSLKKNIRSCPQRNCLTNNDERNKSKSLSPVRNVNLCTETPPFVTKSRPRYTKNMSSSMILFDSDGLTNSSKNRTLNRGDSVTDNFENFVNDLKVIHPEEKKIVDASEPNPKKDFQKYSTPQINRIVNNLSPKSAKIMTDLYGDTWITTPGLMKKKAKKILTKNRKHLSFDSDSDDANRYNKSFEIELVDRLTNLNLSVNKNADTLSNRSTPTNGNRASGESSPDVIKFVKKNNKKHLLSSDEDDECERLKNLIRTEINDLNPMTNVQTTEDLAIDILISSEAPKTVRKHKTKQNKENFNDFNTPNCINEIQPRFYGFMASLGDNIPPSQRHPKAHFYKQNFKSKKEELSRVLFKMFNKNVFEQKLDHNLPIIWSNSLNTTAGRAHNKIVKNGEKTRESKVELSVKVVDDTAKLRRTLAHELCHVATWIIDGQLRDAHGPYWKAWVNKILERYPEIQSITRCHSYEIKYKFTYTCVRCGYSIGRHSKSIDTQRKRCGYCYGKFNLIHNKVQKDGAVVSTPIKDKKVPTGFALFVKENYGNVRSGNTPHKETMKYLSKQYARQKQSSSDDNN